MGQGNIVGSNPLNGRDFDLRSENVMVQTLELLNGKHCTNVMHFKIQILLRYWSPRLVIFTTMLSHVPF